MTRVALVSGASRGIGAGTAKELARRGFHVVVNYHRNADAAKDVVEAIEAEGGAARAVQADVCDAEAVAALFAEVRAEHGRLDVLVCNANTVHPPFEQFDTLTWESFSGKVNGELAGVFHLTKQALVDMSAQRSGRIVYVSSIDADMVGGSPAQAVAKAALNNLGRQVAGFAGLYGITVNVVAPGAVSTDASAGVLTGDLREFVADRSVLRRVLEADDVGRLIASVASDAFGAATGQLIRADGGLDVLSQVVSTVGRRMTDA